MQSVRTVRLAAWLVIAVLLVGMSLGRLSADETTPEESWQVVRLSGQKIGYGRTIVRTIEEDGRTLAVTESRQQLTIRRFGQVLEMMVEQTIVETEEGELVRFHYVMNNPPNSRLETLGVMEGDQLRITTTVLETVQEQVLSDLGEVKSPLWLDRSIELEPLQAGESRRARVFFPEFNQAVELVITAEELEEIERYDGSRVTAMRLSMPNPLLANVEIQSFFVEGEGIVLGRTSLLDMEFEVVPAEIALQDVEGTEIDLVTQSLVRVKGLDRPHVAQRAVYRITTRTDGAADGFVNEGSQSVEEIDERTIELTVRRVLPGEDVPADPENMPPQEYLQASSFLDSRDEEVRKLAEEGASGLTSPRAIALALERFVHDRVITKDFSTGLARASEVARTLTGDCTEHAVLLAAMLRVKGIPSRVCVGLVYVEVLGAFGGHMWTEAWIGGEWVPLDATLGAGGIGVGHLKLAHSSMEEDSPTPLSLFGPVIFLTGQLKIEVLEIEH